MTGANSRRVTALVLTYNAPAALDICLSAIAHQTRAPEQVLVVDNASTPPARVENTVGVRHTLLRRAENGGPAGGYASGIDHYLREDDSELLWILDDDALPEPDCLERLLEADALAPVPTLHWPRVRTADGGSKPLLGWNGVLLPRTAVERLGLPRVEMFWWKEDMEYLYWRSAQLGLPRADAAGAFCRNTEIRATQHKPPWKHYYETRNLVWYRLHVQRRMPASDVALVARKAARVLAREPHKTHKLRLIGKGVLDGLRGRLGKRVKVPNP